MIRTTQSIHHDQVRHDTHADPFLFDFSQMIFTRFNKLLTNRTSVASSFLSFDFSVLDKAFLFHDVGSNARTTSLSHSHPLGTKITRQPRGLDAFLWAPHFAASTPSLGRYISRRLYLLGPTFLCVSARYIFLRLLNFLPAPFLSGCAQNNS